MHRDCPSARAGRRTLTAALLIISAFLLLDQPASAQRAPGDIGLGLEIGEPSGITLFVYSPPGPSWDFLAAWDIDDFFFLNLHAVFERHLGARNDLHFFFGPGGFIGVRDRGDDDDVVIGISGTFGLGFLIERFEIYGRVTPRLSVVPDTDGDVGAGVGFRYFF